MDNLSPDDTCDVPGCHELVENFPEPFPVPARVFDEAFIEGATDGSDLVMCDHHHVAARILAYTRPDHPYVDVGLYQEVCYYSRSLAAETFGIPAQEKVNQPEAPDDE